MLTASACLLSLVSAACFFGIAAQKTVSPECENATLGDIVFLIDGFTNISPGNFQEMRTFLQNIIKSLDIGPQKVRVGLAWHSDDVRREILLKEHMDHKSLLAAVEQITYLKGGNAKPLTGNAIDRIREEFFREAAGSRASQRVPQIAVVITGGESGDEVETPAQRLRQHGVVVFGIGVGKYSQTQLETIANRPPERFLNTRQNFQDLSGLTDSLLMSVCISMEEKREALANKFADIFFLVDNGLLPQQFKLFKNELRRLVNQTDAGTSGYRFGLALYGQDIKVEFDLNSHQTKKQILKAVENVKHLQTNQPRNLGNALKYAARNLFTIEKGGRAQQGAEQFLVIVIGKTSDDRVVRPAKAVKSTGVTVVGVSPSVSQKDLERFASWGFTHNTLKVTELKDMLTTKKVETVTEDCKGANIADIVFVVDESTSIGKENFQLIRFFLHSVVSSLNVSHATVRVGIVTYSKTPTVQAYLKDYKDKAGILQFINDLSYRGGPRTNTGAALNVTRNKIFQEEQGSRKGVQKVAIVITDGKSHDDVREAAIALRRMGVTIYAVGVKIDNMTKLEMMASHPSRHHVFNVSSFDLLKPLKENLQKSLCNNIIKNSIPKKDVKEACKQKDEADIYFLIDDSGSITTLDFNDMKKFVIEFLKIFHIGPHHVRIGLVKYSDSPTLEFNLAKHSNAKDIEEAVGKIQHAGGGTNTGNALVYMEDLLEEAAKTRQVPKYLVVITDGKSADEVKGPAETLRLQGVTIFAIGVKKYNETQLHEIAGDSKRTFHVRDFDALKSINNDIFTEICAAAVCKDVRSDIFFLTDSSESISEEDFIKMKFFMKSVISKSPIGRNEVQVGVMQFSTNQKLEFGLNKYHSKEEIMKAIDDMEQMNEDSQPGKAITEVSKYFNELNGGRRTLRQVLLLITDNRVNDEVWGPAEALRASGVVIYTVGVMEAIIHQLVQISGTFEQTFIQLDFDALQEEISPLGLALCDPQRECKKTKKADIIFLVDSSKSILPDQFRSMQIFMDSIVNLTTVGREQTRFGIILFSDEPESKFELKDSKSRQQVHEEIYSLEKMDGDTYTGKALKYSLQFFNDKHGGRRKVPQVLMVITDGAATNPYNLKEPSDALRSNNISVFSIGVKDASTDELKVIAGGDESKVFFVDKFKELETLSKEIFPAFCNDTKPTHCKKSDIVFLLDHSSSINEENSANYATILNFVAEVVGKFKISLEWVRIGLAQFSDNPKHEFYLNDYDSTEKVVERIRGLEYHGGNTYLGKALKHMKDYFKESTGSRRDIPKTLLVVSDGDSHDDVEDEADELRKMGIDIFAIGIGGINILRLLQTTGTPERIFHVENFDSLKSITKKIYDELCGEEIPDDPTDCSIDVAVGFDISTTKTPSVPLMKYVTRLEEVVRQVSGIQDACCTSPIQTKMAFYVGPFQRQSLYETNFEAFNEEVMKKVLTTSLSQPSFFDSALFNFFKEKFKNKSTARVKVLLIFSDGLNENVMKLEQESELLRRSGVDTLLTVALQDANPSQLQMVEFGRGFSHHLDIRIGMPSLGGIVRQQIRAVANRVCCNVTCECTGPEGSRGLHGLPGTKGPSGMKGQRGFAGDEGVPGRRGNPGPNGLQGLQGCPGKRGQKGSRSFSGRRGEDGEDGDDAVNGEQGETGRDGIQGERGHPGNPGNPGIRGEPGLKGQRGLRGDTGEPGTNNTIPGMKGEPGDPGLPGPSGLNGRPGAKGGPGNKGADGRRGYSGETGSRGDTGSPGPPGIPGASGPQGRRGGPGEKGPDGPPGLPGAQGKPGLPGDPGQAGRRGAMGQKGQPGDPGVKGVPGIQGPRGMPGSDGRDGFGPEGPKGAKGDPGFPGYPGQQGNRGLKGSRGDPGRKGTQGRRGNSGRSGDEGASGNPGYPGRRGERGPPGGRGQTDCELITFIKDKCVCSHGVPGCPVYPTELVFGLDQSSDMALGLFERQRKALLTLLEDITIAESSCPTGARVAVVGYGAQTRSLIRFQEHRSKKQLVAAVQDIPWQRTKEQRDLGAAMLFVGQNIFKRVRSGLRMRKVAIFFTNGPPQDTSDIVVAMMVYRALNIIPVVISLKNDVNIAEAMKVDDSGNSIFTVLGRLQTMAADLRKIRKCAICYDPCRPSEECSFIQDQQQPQQVEVDLAMVLDGSREMQAKEYAGAQQLLSSVVEQLAVSPQPQRPSNRARVAMVQQSTFWNPKLEFGLQTYQNQKLMRRHLIQNMQQQGGLSVLGKTLDYTLKEVLLKAGQPGRRKVLLAVVATQTDSRDQVWLSYVSQKAKCDGVALFVVTVGNRYNRTQVEEMAGLPVQQHLIHVSRLVADEQGYVQRFFRVFLSALSKGMNTYPPVSLRRTCDQLSGRIVNIQPGVADLEDAYREEGYQEQTGGQTQTGQLDMVESVIRGNHQGFVSEVNTNGGPHSPQQARCQLDADAGVPCADYVQAWFFDPNIGACAAFWYGGCGGNANRFNTEHECFRTCGIPNPSVVLQTELTSFPSKDACLQRQDPGSCQNYTMMWFFDTTQSECSRFWYSGCGGNQNRFKTQDECENLCLTTSR